jgi:hypothetical protein
MPYYFNIFSPNIYIKVNYKDSTGQRKMLISKQYFNILSYNIKNRGA